MHFHVVLDSDAAGAQWQLMTEVPDLVSTGVNMSSYSPTRARFQIYSVEAPGWMDVVEFKDWIDDHRKLTQIYDALPSWERHVWGQFRKLLPENKNSKYAGRFIAATCYLLKANLRSAERIAAREHLQHWIDSRADFDPANFLPGVRILSIGMEGFGHNGGSIEAWKRVNPDYPWFSAEIESHQAALVNVAARMRKLVRAAEAQRIRLAPKSIVTTDDDLAALGDVFG